MPPTFVFQLSGEALGVEIKEDRRRNITSMKQLALEKHFLRNIVKGGRSLLYRNSLAGRKKVKVLRANTKDIETMIINDQSDY